MTELLEILKAVLFGIVEGITEWLPVSSTGHLILLNEFVNLNVTKEFQSMFDVVIQLGAILAVCALFFRKLNPFDRDKNELQKKQTWNLWFKVIAAIIPSGVVGVLFDDWMDEHLHTATVVAIALIVYGVAFILVERRNQDRQPKVGDVHDIGLTTALLIGLSQCLSLVPGTSRSGSTILGAILLGVGRSAGAEFSFFMAIPTMLGASAIKGLKFLLSGVGITGLEIGILVVGCVVSFVVSLLVIKGLMEYVRKQHPNACLMAFPDHHRFNKKDVERILYKAQCYDTILTTEKDYQRIVETSLVEQLGNLLHTLPIQVVLRGDSNKDFDQDILNYVKQNL